MNIYASTTCIGRGKTHLENSMQQLIELYERDVIQGIELGSIHIHDDEILSFIDKLGGDVPLVTHNYFPPARSEIVINLASNDEAIRMASVEHAIYCIEVAKRIGAKIYTIHPGFMAKNAIASTVNMGQNAYDFQFIGNGITQPEAFELMVDSLNRLAITAEQNDVTLAIETEGSLSSPNMLLMERPSEYEAINHRLSKKIKFNLNLAHSRFASIQHEFLLSEFISKISDDIVLIELSDNDGFRDQHKPIARDSYIFRYLNQLSQIDAPLILEFRNSSIGDIENSVNFIKGINQV
jgi:sugar phosphate isomerase/epimerase